MAKRFPIRRCLTALITGTACLLTLGGCLKKSEYITERIGIALGPRNNNWGAAVVKYGTVEAASYTLPYFLANAKDSAAQQNQLLSMMFPENENLSPCKAIILNSVSQDLRSLDRIIATQVPLILFEQPIEGVDYACLVTGDNAQAGEQAAAFILDTLKTTPPRVLTLEASDTNYKIRMEAFRTRLGVETIDSLVDTPTQLAGKEMMLSVLATEGWEQINAVYTADDDLALGVMEALNTQNNTTIRVVVGCGGEQKLLNLIQSTDNRALATTLYSPAMIRSCVEIAYRLAILGEAPAQKEIHHPSVLIDRSNLAEYLDPESYY